MKANNKMVFILTMGILTGGIQLTNFLFIYLIGYGVLFTLLLTTVFSQIYILKEYNTWFKSKLEFIPSIIFGFPIFFICSLVVVTVTEKLNYGRTIFIQNFDLNYVSHLTQEVSMQVILMTIMFTAVTRPIYYRTRSKCNQTKEQD